LGLSARKNESGTVTDIFEG